MKLEFRVPISPRPEFYAQVRLLVHSLARMGAPYREAIVQVSVGEQPAYADVLAANRWSEGLPVRWYVVPEDVHARIPGPWWASGFGRYACPSDADIVVLCDADICPVDRFDSLLAQLAGEAPRVAGLQAHFRPFEDSDTRWRALLEAIGHAGAPIAVPYSMDVAGTHGLAPPYFNYGFVAFNAAAFRAIASDMERCLGLACRLLPDNGFAAQIALTFAMLAAGAEAIQLGHEYNCANDPLLLQHRLADPERISIVHYLRGDDLDRHRFLVDHEKFHAFVSTPRTNAINERLRRHVVGLGGMLFGEGT